MNFDYKDLSAQKFLNMFRGQARPFLVVSIAPSKVLLLKIMYEMSLYFVRFSSFLDFRS